MENIIEINELCKTYENGVKALDKISFNIKEGDFFALLGPNGAGKTTTIGILSNLVTKTSGKIKVCGHDLDTNVIGVKMSLGIVPQEFNFNFFERCWDILIQQAGYFGVPPKVAGERAEKYLRLLDLWDKRFEISRNLSGGMKRRFMMVRALIHDPKILILDEPTAGVDIEIRRGIWEFLKDLNKKDNKTIILTTHYLEEVELLCEHVAIVQKGKLQSLTSKKDLLRQLQKQTFILDLISKAPEKFEDIPHKISIKSVDEDTLEVEVRDNFDLNELFNYLTQKKVRVKSMRSKMNRIEELFIELLKKK